MKVDFCTKAFCALLICPSALALADGADGFSWAAGTDILFVRRTEFGSQAFTRLTPSVLGYGYFPLGSAQLFARTGLRVGYGSTQPEMPQGFAVEETDLLLEWEGGILWSGPIIPALSLGFGLDRRKTELHVSDAVEVQGSPVSRSENLGYAFWQVGVGFPFFQNHLVIEPKLRWWNMPDDKRFLLSYGLEFTLSP